MAEGINRLIATQQSPNLLGAITGGVQARQSQQANQMNLQAAQQKQERQNRLLELYSQGASPQQLQQGGFGAEALQTQKLQAGQQTMLGAEEKKAGQMALALTQGVTTPEEYEQRILNAPDSMLSPEYKEIALELGPQGLRKFAGETGIGDNVLEIRKETRGEIRKQLGNISNEASTIKSNWTKLNNLAGEIRKGNRTAVPQALVSIVKLGDPGSIVSTNEMQGAINAEDPVSAVYSLLTQKGVDTNLAESVANKIDPLNPDNINVDDLLATGRATVSAFVPSIQGRMQSMRQLAEGNLSNEGINALFSNRLMEDIDSLGNIIGGNGGGNDNELTPAEQAELTRLEAELNANR